MYGISVSECTPVFSTRAHLVGHGEPPQPDDLQQAALDGDDLAAVVPFGDRDVEGGDPCERAVDNNSNNNSKAPTSSTVSRRV